MELKEISNTGLNVTPICFGGSAIGNMPDTYGYEVNETQARETLEAIFDGPINFLDTANNYGFGESEARIGDAIKAMGGLPKGFVLSTKLDRVTETGRFDADRVKESLDESLSRLNLDTIPLLHLHDPEHARDLGEITREGGALDALFKLKEEGIVQAVGLAMGTINLMYDILKDRPFDAIISHNRWTVINRSADKVFKEAESRGIAILNAAPFAGGVLAKGSAQMPRISYSMATDEDLIPIREFEAICAKHGVAPGAAALQFSLMEPRITSTIVGVSKKERVAETLDWANFEIPKGFWDELKEFTPSYDDPEANRIYKLG